MVELLGIMSRLFEKDCAQQNTSLTFACAYLTTYPKRTLQNLHRRSVYAHESFVRNKKKNVAVIHSAASGYVQGFR